MEPARVAELLALLMLFLVLPLGSALLLSRPSLTTKAPIFWASTAFLAACLFAVMAGLALGMAAMVTSTDPGCWKPPVGWHGCRAPETLSGLLVYGAIVVAIFVVWARVWRSVRLWRKDKPDRSMPAPGVQ